ncbi:phage protein [Streptococcus pneumoniae]|nr:phage protein [Streptococcus pneumoniae]
MTPEQVKEKLEGVKWINKEIKGLYLELETLEGGIIKKPTLSHSRVQTSRENKTENNLISVLKLKEDTLQRIERLTEERMKISELIDKLANPLERSALRLFYLNDLVVSEVAEEIDRSNTTVYIIRQKAIEHLTGIVNGD